jgi:RHS repeat-associated protein
MSRTTALRRALFSACVALGLLIPRPAAAQAGTVEYYGTDAVGSVRIVFDAAGTVVGRMDYGPFGEQISASTVGQKSFAGLFRDGEAGLDYAEARSYQVRTGRFSAPDPVYAGLFDPQGWNRYSYALNSPVVFTDPSGLCPTGKICTETVGDLPNEAAPPPPPRSGRDDVWWWTPFGTVFEVDWSHLDWAPDGAGGGGSGAGNCLLKCLEGIDDEVQVAASPQGAAAAAVITAIVAAGQAAAANVPRLGRSASVWGTHVHTAMRNTIKGLNLPGVGTEVSYRAGQIVDYGTRGSVRLDVVITQGRQVLQVFDLKTGQAGMSIGRMHQIYSALRQSPTPPITIIKP